MLKSELVDLIMGQIKDQFDSKFDFWQDITGAIEALGVDDSDVVRLSLEGLQERNLLVPLLLKAYDEGMIDWQFVDSIAGNYGVLLLPKILNSMSKKKLETLIEFYGE